VLSSRLHFAYIRAPWDSEGALLLPSGMVAHFRHAPPTQVDCTFCLRGYLKSICRKQVDRPVLAGVEHDFHDVHKSEDPYTIATIKNGFCNGYGGSAVCQIVHLDLQDSGDSCLYQMVHLDLQDSGGSCRVCQMVHLDLLVLTNGNHTCEHKGGLLSGPVSSGVMFDPRHRSAALARGSVVKVGSGGGGHRRRHRESKEREGERGG